MKWPASYLLDAIDIVRRASAPSLNTTRCWCRGRSCSRCHSLVAPLPNVPKKLVKLMLTFPQSCAPTEHVFQPSHDRNALLGNKIFKGSLPPELVRRGASCWSAACRSAFNQNLRSVRE